MRIVAAALLCLFCSSVVGAQQSDKEREHLVWIASAIAAAESIHPGMHRQDLATKFGEEGGLSTRSERTYVWRECAYIKIRVQFEPINDDAFTEDPDDIITSVSDPYLQYSIMD
jgi:hypothetical protein